MSGNRSAAIIPSTKYGKFEEVKVFFRFRIEMKISNLFLSILKWLEKRRNSYTCPCCRNSIIETNEVVRKATMYFTDH